MLSCYDCCYMIHEPIRHKLLNVTQPRRNEMIMFLSGRVMNWTCMILRNYFNIFLKNGRPRKVIHTADLPTKILNTKQPTNQPTSQPTAVIGTHLSRSSEYTGNVKTIYVKKKARDLKQANIQLIS
jgi:hypothetical protein